MRISDWSSDVCSSDLRTRSRDRGRRHPRGALHRSWRQGGGRWCRRRCDARLLHDRELRRPERHRGGREGQRLYALQRRTEEYTFELQSLIHITYTVYFLKNINISYTNNNNTNF